jgi:hypothetical protein
MRCGPSAVLGVKRVAMQCGPSTRTGGNCVASPRAAFVLVRPTYVAHIKETTMVTSERQSIHTFRDLPYHEAENPSQTVG